MLHGYGQTPEDLGAAIIFISNWMNNPGDSASSPAKAILVYVDGRCRVPTTARPSASAATFFGDSPRDGGPRTRLVARADGRNRHALPHDGADRGHLAGVTRS
jgi:hypothetical protein